MTKNIKITLRNSSIADLKKHYFFLIIPQEKYIDEMKIGTSSICWLFFMKKAPDLLPHEYDFFLVKNKTYTSEEQNARGAFPFSFSFWTYKKKHFTLKPILTQKVFASTRSCWSSVFWAKIGFCVKCFFVCSKRKGK